MSHCSAFRMVGGSVVVLGSGTLIVLLAWVESSAGLFSLWQSFVWNWRILDILSGKKFCPSFLHGGGNPKSQHHWYGQDCFSLMHFEISGFTHVGL